MRRPLSAAVVVSALVLGSPGMAACATAPAQVPARVPAHVVGGPALAGEQLRIAGWTGVAHRPLVLERYRHGWHRVSSTRSGDGNRYHFAVTATARTATYRVLAPAAQGAPRGYSRPLRLAAVTPTARVGVSGAPVGQTRGGQTAFPAEATFWPRRPGAPARLAVLRDGAWQTLKAGRQDAAGHLTGMLSPALVASGVRVRAISRPVPHRARVRSLPVQAVAWRQVFDDDFDGTALDPAKWRTREQPPNGRRMCATPSPDRVSVSGGTAVLSIKRVGRRTATCPHGVFTNAMIGTATPGFPGFMAKYGTFAARIEFQSGQGQHGAFWMQGPTATGAEIDTAEYYGDGRRDGGYSTLVHHNDASGALHSAGGLRPRSVLDALLAPGTTPASSWHVYSVDWSPRGYVFRMDGHPVFRTRRPYVARSPEIMVLSLLTSDWELPALNTTTSVMQVDWVRAWQR